MRFELSNKTPPHLNRRLQLRMLSFVALFGIALFVLNIYSPVQKKPTAGTGPGRQKSSLADSNTVDADDGQPKDGVFVMPPDLERREPVLPDRPDDWKEPPRVDDLSVPESPEHQLAVRDAAFDKRYLESVKDNTVGIRRDEADAYYRLLDHARNVPSSDLEMAAFTDVLYINLMQDPRKYRGEPVRVRGDLFRLRKFPASANSHRVKAVYEAWIFTSDSAPHPYRVICTSIPNDLPEGENLRKPVEFIGYFFKREGYWSNGGMHLAPTMLAGRLDNYWVPGSPPPTTAIVPYMVGFVSAVGLAFLVTLLSFTISDRRAARALLQRKMNEPAPSFAGINGGPMHSVADSLRMLEEEEWESAASDQVGIDPAVALHARDRNSNHRAETSSKAPTEVELVERRKMEAQTVHAWTTHQKSDLPVPGQPKNERDRESREVDRVLSRLESNPSEPNGEAQAGESADQSTNRQQHWNVLPNDIPPPPLDNGPVGSAHSKLAAWELEIQQISNARAVGGKPPVTAEERVAQEEVEQDRRERDRRLDMQLRNERAELEHEQRLQAEPQRESQHHESTADENHADAEELARERAAYEHLRLERAERDQQNS